MASRPEPGPPPAEDSIIALKTKLYDICKQHDASKLFRQDDLMGFGVIPNNDPGLLLKVAQRLCDERLFKILSDGTLGWQIRSVDDAMKYDTLSYEERIIYALIDEAGADGVWSRTLKTKTNLHESLLRGAIRKLEAKGLIADMKSVENPTRKMFIKASIRPSERATGGPWYTDNELDEEFIDTLGNILYSYIKSKSFYKSNTPSMKKPRKGKQTVEELKAARDKHFEEGTKGDDDQHTAKRVKYDNLLPLPAGYQGYPNLGELTLFIENSSVTETTLTEADVQQLLDVLCYDDRIEQVTAGPTGIAYKAVKKAVDEIEDGPSNALTETPCGRCPVFDLCEEGGPVGPSNCPYFKDWLEI